MARKSGGGPGTPKMEASQPVTFEGTLAAAADPTPEPVPSPGLAGAAKTIEELRSRVLAALQDANCKGIFLLEEGDWDLRGGELTVKVGASDTVADMTLSPDAKRLATQAASAAAGRVLRLRIIGGNGGAQNPQRSSAPAGSARSRAAEDAVVKRMQEKFGAQIRTVIDHRDKR